MHIKFCVENFNVTDHLDEVGTNGRYEGYSESNLRLSQVTNVAVRESSSIRGSVT
jgi:hypothetical protein